MMKQCWKVLLTLLLLVTMTAAVTACGDKTKDSRTDQEVSDTDVDYDVEEDLVEGVLTDEMLDEMEEEETAEEDKKEESDKKTEQNKYYIKVNRQTNVVTVYTYDGNGKYTVPVKAFVCSTGKNNGTPTGTFKLSTKHRWQLMNGGVYSQYASRITGHILFHSVPYYEMKNNTLCTNYYNQLGSQASAGCVRLSCADSKWIYSNCASGTVVEIFDGNTASDPLGKPEAIRISTSSPYKKWDPTDPDSDNPWNKLADTAPTIEGAKSCTVELGSGKVNLTDGVTAKDAYGLTLSVSVSGNVDTGTCGTYSITYSATDSRGNTGKTSITVTVKDTTAPAISCSVNGKEYKDQREEETIRQYVKKNTTVKDVSGTASIMDITVSVDESNGKITGMITAKDSAGNVNTLQYTMTFEVEKTPDTEEGGTPEETPETPSTPEEPKDDNTDPTPETGED